MSFSPGPHERGRWRAIVFDLDDTLYSERDFVLSGFRAVARWLEAQAGVPAEQGYGELKALFAAGVRRDTFDRWLSAHSLPANPLVSELVRIYREHEPVLTPFPEVPALLADLHQRYRLGMVSDGILAVQRRKLTALRLAPFFDAVVFSDEWGRDAWKPSPRPFALVLERLGAAPVRSVYVADNPCKDFLGARRAGMFTIRIRRPGGEYARLHPPTAEHAPGDEIDSLSELEDALDRHEAGSSAAS